ncbi:MAG: Plasmid stabilization system [Parcubacteria group bacterium GW2011_GWA2_47_7]|nr:MAG: Plasmid stabilization system [Parcubacteria group bacterium GW2011_GWA2_47_7]
MGEIILYEILYDKRVLEDLRHIDDSVRKKIRIAIEQKLTSQPEIFGKPLRQSLVGFRVLRVGDYRIVFVIKGREVFVLLIGSRQCVYKEAQRHLV